VHLKRAVATATVVGAGLAVLTGCNDSALTKRELVVYFSENAPASQHLAVLKACAHATPAAVPEPVITSKYVSDSVGDVRFRVDHASDKQLATLYSCLERQPGVRGVDIPDLTD
jgi:hypothetical protein